MTEKTFTDELSDDQMEFVREYLTDCICDDMDDAIDFLGTRDDIEMSVSEKVRFMDPHEVLDIVEDYTGCEIEDIVDIGAE